MISRTSRRKSATVFCWNYWNVLQVVFAVQKNTFNMCWTEIKFLVFSKCSFYKHQILSADKNAMKRPLSVEPSLLQVHPESTTHFYCARTLNRSSRFDWGQPPRHNSSYSFRPRYQLAFLASPTDLSHIKQIPVTIRSAYTSSIVCGGLKFLPRLGFSKKV